MNAQNPKRFSRRDFVKLSSLTLGSVAFSRLLAACSPAPTATPTSVPATVAPTVPVLPVDAVAPLAAGGLLPEAEIIVAYYEGPEADRHLTFAPGFTPYSQGKVQVQVETLARETLDSKFSTAMQAGEYIWDAVATFNLNLKQIAEAGWIEPLNQFMDDPELFNAAQYDLEDFPAVLRDMISYNGQIYMLPQEGTAAMFFYRKDLFEKWGIADPPAEGYSWKALREVALQVKEKLAADGMTQTFPLTFGGKVPASALNGFQALWSFGVEVFDADNRPHFNDPKAVEALQFLVDLIFVDEVVSPGIAGYEFMEVLTAVQEENAVMALQFNAAASLWGDIDAAPKVAGKLGFASWPYDEAMGPNQPRIIPVLNCLGIPTSAKDKRAAFEYMTWFTSKEQSRNMVMQLGGNIPRTSVLNDPEVLAKYPDFATLVHGYELYHALPQLNETLAIIFSIAGPHLNAIFAGETPVAEGLAAIDQEIITLLTENGVLS